MEVKFVSKTQPDTGLIGQGVRNAEELIVYCARVTSPQNQTNMDTAERLLRFLLRKRHWSPFEMADLTVEIVTSRAIAAQILRHKSFSFQEFSQRYAEAATIFEAQEARVAGGTNRQGSLEAPELLKDWWDARLKYAQDIAADTYKEAIAKGMAPEVARMVLPLGVQTRLYMKGTVRSWIHYLEARCDPAAQKEHREVALAILAIFTEHFPSTANAVFMEEV